MIVELVYTIPKCIFLILCRFSLFFFFLSFYFYHQFFDKCLDIELVGKFEYLSAGGANCTIKDPLVSYATRGSYITVFYGLFSFPFPSTSPASVVLT